MFRVRKFWKRINIRKNDLVKRGKKPPVTTREESNINNKRKKWDTNSNIMKFFYKIKMKSWQDAETLHV